MTGPDEKKTTDTTDNTDVTNDTRASDDTSNNQQVSGNTSQRSQHQQANQQDMAGQFAQMQRQIAALTDMLNAQQSGVSNQPAQQLDPKMVRSLPGYLPPANAAMHNTRLAVQARKMEADNAQVDLPAAAQPVSLLDAKYVEMPPGGLATLAEHLYLDDYGNNDAMQGHIHDLLMLNRDRLRDDTSHPVGVMVRVQ